MLSAILDVSHYPKSQKMAAISLKLMIGTCNKNRTPLSLGQSTTLTCCRPSWMSAITQNHKTCCLSPHINFHTYWGRNWWLEELPKRFSEDLTHEILSLFWDIFFVTFLKCIKVTHKCFRRGLKRGRLNRTSETLKKIFFQFCWRGYFAHVSITYAIVSHLGCQPLPKITKMAAISLKLMIGTCNKNRTPLSLGQSTTLTCCQPSWMSAITQKSQKWLPFL